MSRKSLRRGLTAAFLVGASGFAFIGTASAAPVTVANTCLGYAVNNDSVNGAPGSTGILLPPGFEFPLDASLSTVDAPSEVNAGSTFNATSLSTGIVVPPQVDTKIVDAGIGVDGSGVVNVFQAANIQITIQIDGAAAIGTPTLSGGDVVGATAKVNPPGSNKILVTLPGRDPGSTIYGSALQFPPSVNNVPSFTSPQIVIPITAGAAGSTIVSHMVNFSSDAQADVFSNNVGFPTRAICNSNANTLGVVNVVTPPPPGAPDAKADNATTNVGTPVTVNVRANDVADATFPIDESSLALVSQPAKGTAVLNADKTVTYTPNAGTSGTDTFTYKLCSALPPPTTTTSTTIEEEQSVPEAIVEPLADVAPCDVATVTVIVNEPVTVTTLKVSSASPTTAAAAAAELPRTGGSSLPLAIGGGVLALAGSLTIAGTRRHRRA